MDIAEARAILEALGTAVPDGLPDAFVILVASKLKELAPVAAEATENASGGNQAGGYPGMTPDQFAERVFANVSQRISNEVAAAQAPLLNRISELQSSFGKIANDSELQAVTSFAEENGRKLFPYEKNPTDPNYIVSRLMRLPKDIRAVEMSAIKNRPALDTFGETMAVNDGDEHGTHGKRIGDGSGDKPSEERLASLRRLSPIGRGIEREQARKAVSRN